MKRFSIARICSILLAVFVLTLVPAQSSSAAKPAQVKNFRLICNGNKSAFLAWDKAKNASYYLIFDYDPVSGSYKRLAKTSARNCEVKKLTVGKIYHLVIQSVNSRKGKTTKSAYSKILEVEGKEINVKGVHGRRYSVKIKKTFWTKDLRTGKRVKVKKGTSGITPAYMKKMHVVKLKNGVKIKVNRNKLKYNNLYLSKSYKLYTKAQAEAFINQKGYSSRTKWLIWVNHYTASVHIFKGSKGQWKRQRIAKCVVGESGRTSLGVFRLLKRASRSGKPQLYFTWNPAKDWGQSIHCRIDQHTRGAYSDGCIRLGDSDLYYLAKHCALGTTVVSY